MPILGNVFMQSFKTNQYYLLLTDKYVYRTRKLNRKLYIKCMIMATLWRRNKTETLKKMSTLNYFVSFI